MSLDVPAPCRWEEKTHVPGERDIEAEVRKYLEECSEEPVQAPGFIQPHGMLLTAREDARIIAQASENTLAFAGLEAQSLLGRPLEGFFDAPSWVRVGRALDKRRAVCPIPVIFAGRPFDLAVHRESGLVLLELEPPAQTADEDDVVSPEDVLDQLRRARSRRELFETIVILLKELFGYDRVMVYALHEDGHGEVVAEAREPHLEPYLGLHYPASDIPTQVRALYRDRPLRIIGDASALPSPLVPEKNPLTGRALDMRRIWLRGVSPVHVAYLRNMGVRATLSFPLNVQGKLVGLVAAHHGEPKLLSIRGRVIAERLSLVLSFEMDILGRNEATEHALRAEVATSRFVEQVTAAGGHEPGLAGHAEALLGLVPSSGVAVVDPSGVATAGQTPGREDVLRIASFLRETMRGNIFATDALGERLPWARRLASIASGLLATSLSDGADLLVIWFRPEIEQTVTWAGDPRHTVTRDPETCGLGPRASFQAWRETVHGRSCTWLPWELDAAERLRAAIVGIVLRRAVELSRLLEEIRAAVAARDDFISMASHELRTPIATLKLSIERIMRALSRAEHAPSSPYVVARLEGSLRQVERMATLVDHLLDVSRITSGSLVLDRTEVDLAALARRVASRLEVQAEAVGTVFTVRGDEPVRGCWDEARLDQIVTNLVSNAIKYGAGQPVEIEVSRSDSEARLVVRDHGIGVPAAAQERIFERFERAVSSNNYGGFGLGLWIVRRLLEQMGGRVSVASEEGKGATFTVSLPRDQGCEERPSPVSGASGAT